MLEAQYLIKQGIACRVGSGDTVSILEDIWLLDVGNPYITADNVSVKGQKVSSLMVTGEMR